MEKLQAGEQAASLLAEAIPADMILLDEKSARRVAADRGLRITGTLGVLGKPRHEASLTWKRPSISSGKRAFDILRRC